MVLKTRSCSLLTMLRSSSPSDAIALVYMCRTLLLTDSACYEMAKQHQLRNVECATRRFVAEKAWWEYVGEGNVADGGFVGT
jgi:hypothetical protein